MTAVLRAEGLTKRFSLRGGYRVHAVENVSLEVLGGQTVAVVGESGCGKTTLGNLLLRMLEPDAGRIVLDGEDVTHLSQRALSPRRVKMQAISQDPFASLNPRQTVGDAVGEPLAVHHLGTPAAMRERVGELFRLIGLRPDDMGKYPHQFSGGQRQRICIARAMTLRPKVIVADEPTSALDVSVQARVINLMLDLQEQFGVAYVFISHNLAVVERIAHTVAVMYLGQVVEVGSRRAVLEDPRHPYTARLLAAVPAGDPGARGRERPRLAGEIASPVWRRGEGPERVALEQVAPAHWVARPEPVAAVGAVC